MIINLLINALLLVFGAFFLIFPVVHLPEVLSTPLTMASSAWYGIFETIPYLEVVWNTFLYILIPFEISMIIIKFFLGHRVPSHHDIH